jgi:DNA repair protein RecO (recombination protein O)
MTSDTTTGQHGPAFVLHSVPWRETSLVVEIFTAQHGRFPVVAKGAKRPRSALRSVLHPFQLLKASWVGQGELKTLRHAEWLGGIPLLTGGGLFCGFYLNELVLKLTARDDPHPDLFTLYHQAMVNLARNQPFEPVLRSFEMHLLQELGYGADFSVEADTGKPVDPEAQYCFRPEEGAIRLGSSDRNAVQFRGKTLLDMAQDRYDDPHTLQQAKWLMRQLLGHHLGSQELTTRRIIQELPSL